MTLSEEVLSRIIRRAVKSAITEATAKARTSKQLAGTVEQLDEDLDVVWVRLDNEALSSDPNQSLNFETPGILPATRLGETFTDEQVRVTFDGSAGATAMRTSAQNRVVLPFGAEDGERIDLDGNTGTISQYDVDGELVGYQDPSQWSIGKPGQSLVRVDPLGGLRIRDGDDILRVQLSASEGLVISDPVSGHSGLIANHDGLIILDPATGERISITTGGTSGTPTPSWASSQVINPGSSHSTPAVSDFGTGDDIDIRFTAAGALGDLGAQSYTPPSGWTERTDVNTSGSGLTLASSAATKDPADTPPGAASFTNTSSSWNRRNGHSVVIRGGGTSSPAFRSASTESLSSSLSTVGFDIDAPSGVTEGDLLLAFVAILSDRVPVGWTVPDGWKQLGLVVSGLGSGFSLASGVWYTQAPASPPAMESVTINMGTTGFSRFQSTVVAISDPYEFPAGLDIRLGNRSMPRGLEAQTILASNNPGSPASNSFTTDLALDDVVMIAGRTYAIRCHLPSAIFANLGNARWKIDLRKDATSFEAFGFMQNDGGVTEFGFDSTIHYTPTSNEVVDWDVRAERIAAGTGSTLEFRGNSTASRRLEIVDIGATF